MRIHLATILVLAAIPAVIHSGLAQDRGSAGPAPPAARTCETTAGGGHHPYFEQLVARPDCWKANALRRPAEHPGAHRCRLPPGTEQVGDV